jgi:CRISPR-associated protein Cas2
VASKLWYLISYDIRDPGRLRRAAKNILGRGERVQYSVYRCHLTKAQLEEMLWQMGKFLEEEDSLLVIGLCGSCVKKIEQIGAHHEWPEKEDSFDIV